MSEYKVVAVKADGDAWELDVLGVPFGGPDNRDADGEWFDADTKLHEDRFGLPAIAYYHGANDKGELAEEPAYIGRTVSREQRSDGVWYRVALDKASALAKRVWEAAARGMARASTGTVGHLMRKGEDGRILEWPVAELSIFETDMGKRPANNYAVAVPVLKALGIEIDELSTEAKATEDIESEDVNGETDPPEDASAASATVPDAGDDSEEHGRALKALKLEIELLELEVTS